MFKKPPDKSDKQAKKTDKADKRGKIEKKDGQTDIYFHVKKNFNIATLDILSDL